MECDICSRSSEQAVNLLCAACARNAIYHTRLEHAQLLLDKDSLNREIDDRIKTQQINSSDISTDSRASLEYWDAHVDGIHINETQRRVEAVKRDQSYLNDEIALIKQQIQALRNRITERKQILQEAGSVLPNRHNSYMSHASNTNSKALSSLSRIQQRSAEDRAKLCREAASLMRLRQRRRQRDPAAQDQFSIAGLTLPDLREISHLRCADLSSVLGSVAHLTLRIAFYLGIRLPAEIIEPFVDYPLHTILTPAASYKGIRPDPQITQAPTINISPSASRDESNTLMRPRPLSIGAGAREERVFNFQKRDEQGFRYFVEGISLLAWNVTWLCRSQGFISGTDSWEEICNMGRNLHSMLATTLQTPTISRMQSDRTVQKRGPISRKPSSLLGNGHQLVSGKLGQHSDLIAGANDTQAAVREVLTSWEFVSWHKIAIPLRKMLLTEIASTEWEVLQDEEWDDGGEQFNEAVIVKSRPLDVQQYDDARSIMSVLPRAEDENAKGTSGWMKLKSRDKPT